MLGHLVRAFGGVLLLLSREVCFADLHNPLSIGGQILTCIVVISGMVLGVFTATLTSLYVGEYTEELEQSNSELKQQLLAMQANIEKLC